MKKHIPIFSEFLHKLEGASHFCLSACLGARMERKNGPPKTHTNELLLTVVPACYTGHCLGSF